jgi:thiamine-monophosphate kinase
MGAKPKWFTLALTLPQANEDWLRDFSRGLFNCADEYGIALVGGDTTRGPLTITIQVMGEVPAGVALRRDGAAPDDFIFVTNTLGDGAAALDALTRPNDFSSDVVEYLTQRFYLPEPQIKAGILLRGIASAALDISDGLVADLGHICEASDVGAVIDVANLPFSDALQSVSDINQAREYALCGGDDYQLCFTVSPSKMPELAMLIARGDICATMVGRIERGRGVIAQLDDEPYEISRSGYQHF